MDRRRKELDEHCKGGYHCNAFNVFTDIIGRGVSYGWINWMDRMDGSMDTVLEEEGSRLLIDGSRIGNILLKLISKLILNLFPVESMAVSS